jgi:hypothetical protein
MPRLGFARASLGDPCPHGGVRSLRGLTIIRSHIGMSFLPTPYSTITRYLITHWSLRFAESLQVQCFAFTTQTGSTKALKAVAALGRMNGPVIYLGTLGARCRSAPLAGASAVSPLNQRIDCIAKRRAAASGRSTIVHHDGLSGHRWGT